ncbi:hypothetical protein B2J93_6485 [Marssonina coronariae]|uniref:Methyltransferase domain-containing protein n=1 Tax=Diplocarpon coronariae TaxID=2795749 RepID=A0A218Z4F0_9HELO|nr:hypothetical protein B2J93_6485 [Marssonina coronariae]
MSDLFTLHSDEFIEPLNAYCHRHKNASDESPSRFDGTSTEFRVTRTSPTLCLPLDRSSEVRVDPDIDTAITCRPTSCGSMHPLIEIVAPEDLQKRPVTPSRVLAPPASHPLSKKKRRSSAKSLSELTTVSMVYNEYGELVEEMEVHTSPRSDELSVTQLLRVIKKAYHHELRDKFGKIITPRADGKASVLVDDGIWKHRLSSWDFKHAPRSPRTPRSKDDSPEINSVAVYNGPPRVLEIGCSDGSWCAGFKKEQPDWDFMVPNAQADPAHPGDYFSLVHTTQETPEFTMRNLNCLLAHSKPIPHNLYEFIRAREIFDRIESYKTFLDDIRSLLKPDGVVEFLEIDPRPRVFVGIRKAEDDTDKHKSTPQTDWTDHIADRFKNPRDEELATTVPGWTGRVAERLKATMQPRDGVAAACLKSWFQGAGFWDVKQIVLPIPVGGSTQSGRLLKDYILYQTELENCIPKLFDELPALEIAEIESGAYFMNLHVVTGRKPHEPRPGDLLVDGSRQEMTASKYDAMARHNDSKSSQWKRYDLQDKLTTMMQSLTSLTGVPKSLNQSQKQAALQSIVYRSTSTKDPFKSPPFAPAAQEQQEQEQQQQQQQAIQTRKSSVISLRREES